MKRKVVSEVMLTLLFMGMLSLVFNIQPAKAEAEQITFGSIQELTPTNEDVLFSAWSPDGKKMAYVKRDAIENGTWNIWVKEIGSADSPIQITQNLDNVDFISTLTWSPDGTRVVFQRASWEIAAANSNEPYKVSTILSDPSKSYLAPHISSLPTQNRLAYCDSGGNIFSIEVTDNAEPINGTKVQITNFTNSWAFYPKWSYSNDKITFNVVSGSDVDVYVLNEVASILNGTRLPPTSLDDPRIVTIVNNDNFAGSTSFSFDERLVYYSEDVNGVFDIHNVDYDTHISDWMEGCDFDLFYMNADGSGSPQKIYDQPFNQGYKVASPEGTRISFIMLNESDMDIYIANLLVSEEITTEGGTVVDGSGTTIDIPAGALSKNETITIETPTLNNTPPSTVPLVTARDFGPDGLTFNKPVTITIHYTDASVEGYDEERLQIYYYNESTESWEPLGGTVDTEANTITVEVTHFSIFAVGEKREYVLIIHSSPTGVTFTVDGISRITPWSGTYSEGTSVILVMSETHDGYVWFHWLEDEDTNRIRTVTMDTNITLTGVFTTVPPPPTPVGGKAVPINMPINKPELPVLWMWLSTIMLPLVATVMYVKKRK